jgi:1-pyrroline-5-carboxylate dehydrogenase
MYAARLLKHARAALFVNQRASLSTSVPSWATYDPKSLGHIPTPYAVSNCVNGVWQQDPDSSIIEFPHPLDRDLPFPIFTIPDTTNVTPFVESLRQCPKTGLHNPLKHPERYVQFGEISRKAGHALMQPEVREFFIQSIQACVPKS